MNSFLQSPRYRILITGFLLLVATGCDRRAVVRPAVYLDAIKKAEVNPVGLPASFDLEEKFQALSLDGKVFVQQLDGIGVGYLFVVWRGKGTNFQGVLVCDSLKISELPKDYYERPNIELQIPQWDTEIKTAGTMDAEACVEPTVDQSVFLVGFDLN